jgi:tetratricopeptide (TPR) repeat protein
MAGGVCDQASRSVAAALEIAERVPDLDVGLAGGERLASRVGIASGPVVIGDIAGERDAIVGRTPNLAARLESAADPGEVVVEPVTAALVNDDFDLEPPTPMSLKGFSTAVDVSRVIAPMSRRGRFGSRIRDPAAAPFVGRAAELEKLQRAWNDAQRERGRVVLLSGEAGIGKSRLIHEFAASLPQSPATVHLQCSPFHSSSVLYPVLQVVIREAGVHTTTDDADRRSRLHRYVASWMDDPAEPAVLLANLLQLDGAEPSGNPNRRRLVLEAAVTAWLDAHIDGQPTLVVVEDIHWIDPTTLEMLGRLAGTVDARAVMIVATYRPDWDGAATLSPTTTATTVELGPLPGNQVRELVRSVAGRPIDEAVLDRIAERTDGNPLYAEELTASSGLDGQDMSIPMTLSASLTARLDRLGPAKAAAQAAAVIGREFSAKLLMRLLDRPGTSIWIDELLASGLVHPATGSAHDDLAFRHALVRDAAYESLLAGDRHTLHATIAGLLSSGEVGATEPEVLAQHHAAAEQWDGAVDQWKRAGARAVNVGASIEAVGHLTKALEALTQLPNGAARDATELDILLDLAPASMTVRGYASAEPKAQYDRAVELATQLGDEERRFTALWGGYYITEIQARWRESQANIEQLLALDRSALRPDLPIQIDHAVSTYAAMTGRYDLAIRHCRRIVDTYDRDLHRSHRRRFAAHDPGVCAMEQMAIALLATGHPDRAIEMAARGHTLADELDHPQTTALAGYLRCTLSMTMGDRAAAQPMVRSLIDHCRRFGVSAILRTALFYEKAVLDDREAAFEWLRTQIDPMREQQRTGYFIASLASDCAEAATDVGEYAHALTTLEYAQWVADTTGETTHIGRIHLLRGRVHEARGDRDEALASWQSGAQWAAERSNHWLSLQIATDVTEALHTTRNAGAARTRLARALTRIDGGDGTPPMRRARTVLDPTGRRSE